MFAAKARPNWWPAPRNTGRCLAPAQRARWPCIATSTTTATRPRAAPTPTPATAIATPIAMPPPISIAKTRAKMFDDFLLRALLAGFGVALAAAPIGCFVVWRRMAYFGDATAHAAILGVALSLAFGLPVFTGAVAVALLMALTVSSLSGRGYSMDTLLGVLAHS